ncbi:hypothetical protein QBC36DRAFT_332133 [Triangularia setosa]|uniref:Secreted protein n=1 Tax=Triangularia setosa TaxID=2587417 RepID=A0AAN7A5T0_9PEZI|nr:hypothetical protein QBC36DRAFT_332133 [Podospora setosa]
MFLVFFLLRIMLGVFSGPAGSARTWKRSACRGAGMACKKRVSPHQITMEGFITSQCCACMSLLVRRDPTLWRSLALVVKSEVDIVLRDTWSADSRQSF